jgi:hypothetical protein
MIIALIFTCRLKRIIITETTCRDAGWLPSLLYLGLAIQNSSGLDQPLWRLVATRRWRDRLNLTC